ncbi:hypothetical protein sos41_32500 [Alphaproteobacteria bacterium SO-S41]|nr:hypothetical protein sos41_32500 [Alphaproteobacteria bacterium SO-S41]
MARGNPGRLHLGFDEDAARGFHRAAEIREMRYVLLGLLLLVLAFAGWLAFAPTPIDPIAWTPAANPGLTGPFLPNEKLKGATLARVTPGKGPEDIAQGPDGLIYTGLEDGSIVRLKADGSTPPEKIASTGGRPFGLKFADDGSLIVADGRRGLLSIGVDGTVRVLAVKAGGVPIAFADDLDIAADGTIYFSDASRRGPDNFGLDAWEGKGTGRLLAYDPASGETKVLLDDLRFANGVALAPDESFVLVNETFAYRVTRYWLSGPKAGTHDIFLDALPAFPDNISSDGTGVFWIAMVSPRNDTLDGLAERPLLRKMVFNFFGLFGMPETSGAYGWVIAADAKGQVIANLQDPSGRLHDITSVKRFGDTLVLGSLAMDAIATLPAP